MREILARFSTLQHANPRRRGASDSPGAGRQATAGTASEEDLVGSTSDFSNYGFSARSVGFACARRHSPQIHRHIPRGMPTMGCMRPLK
jgi:hypothetical protein